VLQPRLIKTYKTITGTLGPVTTREGLLLKKQGFGLRD
jgi:hypothetical protein